MRILKISEVVEPEIANDRFYGYFLRAFNENQVEWKLQSEKWNVRKLGEENAMTVSYVGYIAIGETITNRVFSYLVKIYFLIADDMRLYIERGYDMYGKEIDPKNSTFKRSLTFKRAIVELWFNIKMSPTGADMEKVASWTTAGAQSSADIDNYFVKKDVKDILENKLNIRGIKFPDEMDAEEAEKQKGKIKTSVRLTKRKRKSRLEEATELKIFIDPKKMGGHEVYYITTELETGKTSLPKLLKDRRDDGAPLTAEDAMEILTQHVENAKNYRNYVDKSSKSEYIPEGSTPQNYDFDMNRKKEDASETDMVISPTKPAIELSPPFEQVEDLKDLLGETKRQYKYSQDYGGYFTGDVPDYAADILGTPSVDAGQIKSMFGKADKAIDLVNRFNSSLLSNVSFIFNFAKSGAYGVYLSALDRMIKTKALKKKLEAQGYKVEQNEQGMLTAYPLKEEKSPDEIQADIDRLYADLETKGGSAFGINMNSILQAAKSDAMQAQSPDLNAWEWMALLHLAGTIVHEATHAKGDMGESGPEAAEAQFLQQALPIVNEEYQRSMEQEGRIEEFAPLTIGTTKRHAYGRNWYKYAQSLPYYVPQSFLDRPSGSDLEGRYSMGINSDQGMAAWDMIMQEDQHVPLEKRLGRQYMSPLPPDLSQENDSYEEQLRKYTRDDWKLDPKATMEELLSEGHEGNRYITLEGLLDETRPTPLILPLKKKKLATEASKKITKVATSFGWMNNLEISDGNTIPGLSDRVMSWESREEDFVDREKEIRQQPRYNPTYDIKGFYYRWIEPRFRPQLFDDMTRDYSNTHPAKRFAASVEIDPEVASILSVLVAAKKKILKRKILSTRFIITDDVMPVVDKIFSGPDFRIDVFNFGKTDAGEEIYAVWVSSPEIKGSNIEKAEKYFQEKDDEKVDDLLEELFRVSSQRRKNIDKIIGTVKDICKEYGVRDLYLVGGYPREMVLNRSATNVDEMDFSAAWANQSIKVGGLVAERLGVKDVNIFKNTMTLSFVYKDIKVDFKGDFVPIEVKGVLRERGIPTTPLNMDVYNRDFTINMLAYNISEDKILDICKESINDLEKEVIRTFFDPDYICKLNPIIILRALTLKIKYGFEICSRLQEAMINNASLLLNSISKSQLISARENVLKEGKKEARELFKQFGLEKIEEI